MSSQHSVVTRGAVIAREVHAPAVETQELVVKGTAYVHDLVVVSQTTATLPLGGIRATGDFLLTATTSERDLGWRSSWDWEHRVIAGNRIGQWCSVYWELTPRNGIPSGSTLFSALPETFDPHTKTACAVSVCDGLAVHAGVVIFQPQTRDVRYWGHWPAHATLMATLQYFRAAELS